MTRVERITITALLVALVALAMATGARSDTGCRTAACKDRVWNRAHPFRPALASWFDAVGDGGAVACSRHKFGGQMLIVAHKTLPCGTRLRICSRRCVTARVWDRGPYSGAREFDLDKRVRNAVGFDGVDIIRVRELRP